MSLNAHFILVELRTTPTRHLLVLGSFVIGFCSHPQVLLASQAAPVYVNKTPSRLAFSHDLLAQMTDHSLILWNPTTWKKQGEVQLGSGEFNTALGVGLLANGDFIGLGYRGIEPHYQIHVLSVASPKSLKKEQFLPAPYTTWVGWRIFPDIGHPRQFWVASPDGGVPLSRYSLLTESEKQAVLVSKLPLSHYEFSTLAQFPDGTFMDAHETAIRKIHPDGKIEKFLLGKPVGEYWHIRPGPTANQIWLAFSENTSYAPQGVLQILTLEHGQGIPGRSILFKNAWIHALDFWQDRIAVLLLQQDDESRKTTWTLHVYRKDGSLVSQVPNVPIDHMVFPCDLKISPDGRQVVLLQRDQLWVHQIGSASIVALH